ncbi:alpha/beta fold hydrolase [Parasphingorhabdus cellanae]|uniref:Alpha/beta hydrolase n=1 Tax=Parasphingorhabdus cellanae TaxID=2806553 RepID=A0ABX7T905_9SPHN|nr:alpha/beta hydrolase [Parasphingorhabdus cellanae]QTD57453.1 alpha/beta hydrolase [Parasphingorhabdus cellanae]
MREIVRETRWLRKLTSTIIAPCLLVGCTGESRSDEPVATSGNSAPPITASNDMQVTDPAVTFANANRTGNIGYREGYFGEGNDRIHYVEAGEGPLIIFYHGFPSFWYSWFDQMEALKGEYRVVAVDGLGSGLSAKPQNPAPYDIARLAAQLDALSRHLGGDEKYVLVGHDWGAVLALSYAQAYPNRLHKVIGMSAPPLNALLKHMKTDEEQQKRSQYMQVMRTTTLDQLRATDAAKNIAQRSYQGLLDRGDLTVGEVALFHAALNDPERINAAMNWYRANIPPFEEISDADLWPGAEARIEVPTLFIWGEADQIFVPELIEKVSNYGDDWTTVRLPGINHWTSMEKPELGTQAIVDFLDGKREP